MKKIMLIVSLSLGVVGLNPSVSHAQSLPGKVAARISIDGANSYQISGGQVLKNGTQITIGGSVSEIVVKEGYVYGLGDDGAVYGMMDGNDWSRLTSGDGAVSQFSVTPDHKIWGIGFDGNLYVASASSEWARADNSSSAVPGLPGKAARQVVKEGAYVYRVHEGQVFLNDRQVSIGGFVTEITVRENTIYGLGTDGSIYSMTPNANWNNITPTGAVTHFSVDQEGQLWGTGFDGNLYSAYPYNAWVMH